MGPADATLAGCVAPYTEALHRRPQRLIVRRYTKGLFREIVSANVYFVKFFVFLVIFSQIYRRGGGLWFIPFEKDYALTN